MPDVVPIVSRPVVRDEVLEQRMPEPHEKVCIGGLDTSANRLHLVLSNGEVHRSGPLTGSKWENPDARRQHLAEDAFEIFSCLPRGSSIFCEEPISVQNGKTTRLLGLAAGAIWAAHLSYNLWWMWVANTAWKKDIVGKGNATKEEIAEHVRTHYNYDYDEQDFADAHCLMEFGVRWMAKAAPQQS